MTHRLNPRTARLWAVLLTLTLTLALLVPAFAAPAAFTLPASLTRIEAEAFRANQALVDVVLPEGLSHIGERAFADCKNLRRVTLPSTLTSVATNAFEGCPPIQFITADKPSDAVQAVLDAQTAKLPQSAHPAVSGTWTYTGNSAATHLTVNFGKVELASEHTLTLTTAAGENISLTNTDAYQPIIVAGSSFTLKLEASAGTPCHGFEIVSVTPRYEEDATLKLTLASHTIDINRECKLTANVTGTLNNPSYTFTILQMLDDSVKLVDTRTSNQPEVPYTFTETGNYILYVTATANGLSYASPREAVIVVMPVIELENLRYDVNSDGKTCTLTGYTGAAGLATLPDKIDKYTVTAIGEYAFAGNTALEGTLILPAGLTRLGDCAFYDCTSIAGKLTIPSGVTTIGASAFHNCAGLEEVILPDNLTKLDVASVFANCGELTYHCTPGSKTELLLAEQGIVEMALPASKHPYNYSETEWLGRADTTDLLIRFGQLELAAKDELLLIDDESGATLHRLTNDSDLSQEYHVKGNRVTFLLRSTVGASKPSASKHGFTVSEIRQCTPDMVVIVNTNSAPVNLKFGDPLTGKVEIAGASLENVDIAFTLERKGDDDNFVVEQGPYQNDKVKNEYSFTPYQSGEYRVFVRAMGTESGWVDTAYFNYVVSNEGLFEFSPRADGTLTLTGCRQKAGKLEIPTQYQGKKVTAIGPNAFMQCGFSGAIVIPEGITTIADYAFLGALYDNCTLQLPSTLTSIGAYAFAVGDAKYSLTGQLTIPKNVKTIPVSCFANNNKLGSVKIEDGVTTIESNAFNNCSGVSMFILPNSITQIGDGAFDGCNAAQFFIPRYDSYAFSWLVKNGFGSNII